MKSFEEQFPGYELIPEKKNGWKWLLIWAVALPSAIGLPMAGLYLLSMVNVPTPNEASVNDFSIGTLGNIAASQSQEGAHALAVRSYTDYFKLGGDSPEHMAQFASSLAAVGRMKDALEWSRKAVQAAPESRAARFINDNLEAKAKSTR